MRKSLVALLLVLGAVASSAIPVLAAVSAPSSPEGTTCEWQSTNRGRTPGGYLLAAEIELEGRRDHPQLTQCASFGRRNRPMTGNTCSVPQKGHQLTMARSR